MVGWASVAESRVRFLVDGVHLLELGESEHLDALGAAFASAAGVPLPPPEGESLVLVLDRSRWIQVECKNDYPISRWLSDWTPETPLEAGAPIPVASHQGPRCMHGSPAVPSLGYACGWC